MVFLYLSIFDDLVKPEFLTDDLDDVQHDLNAEHAFGELP